MKSVVKVFECDEVLLSGHIFPLVEVEKAIKKAKDLGCRLWIDGDVLMCELEHAEDVHVYNVELVVSAVLGDMDPTVVSDIVIKSIEPHTNLCTPSCNQCISSRRSQLKQDD